MCDFSFFETKPLLIWLLAAMAFVAAPAAASAACPDSPDVIYCNDFESGSFDGIHHGDDVELITGTAGQETFDGTGALVSHINTSGGGGDAEFGYRFDGVERVYVSFAVRWEGDFTGLNHWFSMHGDRADNQWSCHGNAGCHPNGTRCLSGTGVDMFDTTDTTAGVPGFYTYHLDMNCDSGGYCSGEYAQNICDGCAAKGMPCPSDMQQCCWGDVEKPEPPVTLMRDTWYQVELMVEANSVDNGDAVADGLVVLWVDGEEVVRLDGLRHRTTTELLLNHFIAWNYNPDQDEVYEIRYDDVVISTAPIQGSPPVDDPDAGSTTSDDTGTTSDDTGASNPGGTNDSGTTSPDDTGTVDPDGMTDPSQPVVGEGSCGCRTGDPSGNPYHLLVLLAGAILLVRRSRSSARRAS